MNDIIYLFGNGENVRKCEQQVENVFSMVFSRTQPNTRKYFSKHFLKYNQTHENIFLSGNSIYGKWNIFQKCFYTNQTEPKFVNFFHGGLNYNIFAQSRYVIHLNNYIYKFQGVLKD